MHAAKGVHALSINSGLRSTINLLCLCWTFTAAQWAKSACAGWAQVINILHPGHVLLQIPQARQGKKDQSTISASQASAFSLSKGRCESKDSAVNILKVANGPLAAKIRIFKSKSICCPQPLQIQPAEVVSEVAHKLKTETNFSPNSKKPGSNFRSRKPSSKRSTCRLKPLPLSGFNTFDSQNHKESKTPLKKPHCQNLL